METCLYPLVPGRPGTASHENHLDRPVYLKSTELLHRPHDPFNFYRKLMNNLYIFLEIFNYIEQI